jgi:uncharacterized RDD family membrane protein YckC
MTGTRPVPRRAQDVARRVHGTPQEIATGPQYVGLVTRAIAFAMDAAVLNTVSAVVAAAAALVISVFPVSHQVHTVLVAIGGAVYVAWLIGYFTTFWSTTGQTPGNRAMQIRVSRPGGEPLSPGRALLRAGALVLAALPLFAGFLPILFNGRRRGLADWMADTVVVRAAPPVVAASGNGRPR